MQTPKKYEITYGVPIEEYKVKINEIIDYLEYQKSSPSSEDKPIENKQDFGMNKREYFIQSLPDTLDEKERKNIIFHFDVAIGRINIQMPSA